ncbi:MAG: tRNA (adenosine(37)-N6)-threonylcarbamoyltransferase complex dimerization subunit type 1 TsaB [Candidatus Caccovivens sp.]
MLAINTAFLTANLALKSGDKVVLKELDARSKHSENVLFTIDQMCEDANVEVLNTQTVAVVVGPGSFTGLRIGTAIAKALGCANKNLKFLPLSSLELMAFVVAKQNLANGNFVCALNALSDLYFVAYFDKEGIKLQEESMITKEELSAIELPIFVLKGDLKCGEEIGLNSEDLLDFACKKENEGKFVEVSDLNPMYLRPSQAEANLLKKVN